MKNFEKKLFIIVIFISFILFVLSFVNFRTILKNENKLKIIVTNGAIYDFVKNIGGDKIEIVKLSFLGSKSHIHDIELLPQDIIKLNSADVILKIGFGIDDWLDKYLKHSQIEVYYLNNNIKLIKKNNKINPHYWLSIRNSIIILQNINKILNDLDPKNSFYYNKKTNDYFLKLNELELYAQNTLKNVSQKKVIITHPSFDYLFNDYGISVIANIYSDELKDLLPQEILNLGKVIKNENIKSIFVEKGFVTDLVNQIAKIYDLKMYFLNPIEVIDENESYYDIMKDNIKIISKALE